MALQASARPRTQNVLAQGQSEAYGDTKLHNTIVEVPARLNLKLATVLARILGRSWRRETASRQASGLQVDGNCSKTRRRMAREREEQGLLLLVWRHHITKQYMNDVL